MKIICGADRKSAKNSQNLFIKCHSFLEKSLILILIKVMYTVKVSVDQTNILGEKIKQ